MTTTNEITLHLPVRSTFTNSRPTIPVLLLLRILPRQLRRWAIRTWLRSNGCECYGKLEECAGFIEGHICGVRMVIPVLSMEFTIG